MIKPPVAIEDNLSEEERKRLQAKCEKIGKSDMTTIDKANAISKARKNAQENK